MCPLPQRKGSHSPQAEPPEKFQTTLGHKTGSVSEKAETFLDQESWVKTLMHLSGTSWSFFFCQPECDPDPSKPNLSVHPPYPSQATFFMKINLQN